MPKLLCPAGSSVSRTRGQKPWLRLWPGATVQFHCEASSTSPGSSYRGESTNFHMHGQTSRHRRSRCGHGQSFPIQDTVKYSGQHITAWRCPSWVEAVVDRAALREPSAWAGRGLDAHGLLPSLPAAWHRAPYSPIMEAQEAARVLSRQQSCFLVEVQGGNDREKTPCGGRM